MPREKKIQLRRGTAAQWTSANPILADGETGYEKDTRKKKVGNGFTPWNSLPYFGETTESVRALLESSPIVSVHATPTVDSTGSGSAANLNDDSFSTYWQSASETGGWAAVDCGVACEGHSIGITPRSGDVDDDYYDCLYGAVIESANSSDFSDAQTIHVIKDFPRPLEAVENIFPCTGRIAR